MRKGRNVMKKFFALMMAALMMMSMLAACGSKDTGSADTGAILYHVKNRHIQFGCA